MKRLWLGAGVLVLVGIGIWAVGTGIDRSDLTSGLNTAVLSTTAAIGEVLGGPPAAVPSAALAPEAAPIPQPQTSVLRPTVSPRRPAAEPEDPTIEAATAPSEPALTVPSGGSERVRAQERLVAPVKVYSANDTDVVAPTLTSIRRLTVLPMGFHDDDVMALRDRGK